MFFVLGSGQLERATEFTVIAIDRHRGLVDTGALDVVDGTERSELDRSKATYPQGATGGVRFLKNL